MSNIISFCDYKQRKLEEKIEEELYAEDEMLVKWLMDQNFPEFPDDINFTTCTTTTFTISVDGEIVFSSEDLEDE